MSKLREEVAARYGRGAYRCGWLCITSCIVWIAALCVGTAVLIEVLI